MIRHFSLRCASLFPSIAPRCCSRPRSFPLRASRPPQLPQTRHAGELRRSPHGVPLTIKKRLLRNCSSCRTMIRVMDMDLILLVAAIRGRSMRARCKAKVVPARAELNAHPSAAGFAMIRDRSKLSQINWVPIAPVFASLALVVVTSGCATTGGGWTDADTAAFIGGFSGYPAYSTPAPVYRPPPQRRYVPPPRQTAPVYRPPPQQTYPSGGSSDDCDWENGACSAQ
ncbi:hypothetical protein FHT76_000716 [Rhizobium sp. BK176]|nr:hypothetical protein [Rhizobium sp. BK176]